MIIVLSVFLVGCGNPVDSSDTSIDPVITFNNLLDELAELGAEEELTDDFVAKQFEIQAAFAGVLKSDSDILFLKENDYISFQNTIPHFYELTINYPIAMGNNILFFEDNGTVQIISEALSTDIYGYQFVSFSLSGEKIIVEKRLTNYNDESVQDQTETYIKQNEVWTKE
jgi:hypothetical protein